MNQNRVNLWLGVMLVELVHGLLVSVARGGWKHGKLGESLGQRETYIEARRLCHNYQGNRKE